MGPYPFSILTLYTYNAEQLGAMENMYNGLASPEIREWMLKNRINGLDLMVSGPDD